MRNFQDITTDILNLVDDVEKKIEMCKLLQELCDFHWDTVVEMRKGAFTNAK